MLYDDTLACIGDRYGECRESLNGLLRVLNKQSEGWPDGDWPAMDAFHAAVERVAIDLSTAMTPDLTAAIEADQKEQDDLSDRADAMSY